MSTAMRMVGGILRTVEITASVAITHYDQTIHVTTDIGFAGTGYDTTHKIFTLPNSQTYDSTTDELKVLVNGVHQVEGYQYDYEAGSSATTVTFDNAVPKNARVTFIIEGA